MLKIARSEIYAHPLPEGHRFPMDKYDLIPKQLLREGVVTEDNFFEPGILDEETLLLTHTAEYWQKLKTLSLSPAEIRKTGFPLSERLVERELVICRGTIDCCLYALEFGAAMNVAGGTHHAYPGHGEGFCLLNDFAVAANYLLQHQLASRILIIDLDVHQGNGTAAIFSNSPQVFCFSMHGKENYPAKKETSHLDIELPTGTTDKMYLGILADTLPRILTGFTPDFAFYLSGVDILSTDKLGKLSVSMEGCQQRDHLVYKTLKSLGIPVVTSMGGGYSPAVSTIVNAHCNTFKEAVNAYF
ncbi:MAG TPA: histone deacetylase [Bacteroidia bacterium]|nr:histone deacetylase [Bacteroidia bacterium]